MPSPFAKNFALSLIASVFARVGSAAEAEVAVRGEIVEAATGAPVAARLYVQREDGKFFFAKSAATNGSAVRYEKFRSATVNEMHTTLSAHPFVVALPPGRYSAVVERGKEFFPLTNAFTVGAAPVVLRLPLTRWADMAARGWFSGDTHVHRAPAELPNVLLAEDVNVTHPMVYWTTVSTIAPAQSPQNMKGDFGDQPVRVDATHYWHPRNTEYEIFKVGAKPHTLGAVVILNHKTPFEHPALPLGPIAKQARAEGALLDMEKHSWPWSFAILPVLGLDLFELANNHIWRTEYAVRSFGVPAPPWMRLAGGGGETERDWVTYNLQTWYALLNCGFHLRPTASTGNGVHPVPLGFSRVYVNCPAGFSYDAWMKGLGDGRSFVTTGPMLLAKVPTLNVNPARGAKPTLRVTGEALSEQRLGALEILVNGEVVQRVVPANQAQANGSFVSAFSAEVEFTQSSWLAVRCFEARANGRFRFAHTAPWWFEIEGRPLRPLREQVDWFVARVEEEIRRNTGVIPDAGLAEFKAALAAWKEIQARAR